jgi:EamA domain-containing membrane protein RarD
MNLFVFIYCSLYYRFCQISDEVMYYFPTNRLGTPPQGGVIMLSMFEVLNFLSFITYFKCLDFFREKDITGGLIIFAIFGVNWLIFLYKNRYKRIFLLLGESNRLSRVFSKVLVIAYVFLSIWFFVFAQSN